MHQVLDGQRDALFHLRRRGARHGGGDVQHRNQDLRLFFAGNDGDREDSERQRRRNEERRQLGVEKGVRQTSGDSEVLAGPDSSWLDLNALAGQVAVSGIVDEFFTGGDARTELQRDCLAGAPSVT